MAAVIKHMSPNLTAKETATWFKVVDQEQALLQLITEKSIKIKQDEDQRTIDVTKPYYEQLLIIFPSLFSISFNKIVSMHL
jgi:hypothetical protein